MGSVDVLRNKAEEYLEKARAISDRQHARLLLVQAHNYLKCAEETKLFGTRQVILASSMSVFSGASLTSSMMASSPRSR